MELFPDEILIAIFDFLGREDILNVSLVCKAFYNTSSDNKIWIKKLSYAYLQELRSIGNIRNFLIKAAKERHLEKIIYYLKDRLGFHKSRHQVKTYKHYSWRGKRSAVIYYYKLGESTWVSPRYPVNDSNPIIYRTDNINISVRWQNHLIWTDICIKSPGKVKIKGLYAKVEEHGSRNFMPGKIQYISDPADTAATLLGPYYKMHFCSAPFIVETIAGMRSEKMDDSFFPSHHGTLKYRVNHRNDLIFDRETMLQRYIPLAQNLSDFCNL